MSLRLPSISDDQAPRPGMRRGRVQGRKPLGPVRLVVRRLELDRRHARRDHINDRVAEGPQRRGDSGPVAGELRQEPRRQVLGPGIDPHQDRIPRPTHRLDQAICEVHRRLNSARLVGTRGPPRGPSTTRSCQTPLRPNLVDVPATGFGARSRNSKWNRHVRFFNPGARLRRMHLSRSSSSPLRPSIARHECLANANDGRNELMSYRNPQRRLRLQSRGD